MTNWTEPTTGNRQPDQIGNWTATDWKPNGASDEAENKNRMTTEPAIRRSRQSATRQNWKPDGAGDKVGNRNRMTTELATGGNRKEPAIDNCTATEQKPDMDQTDRMGDGRDGRMIGSCGELK
mgnify:CR=1 FL=1